MTQHIGVAMSGAGRRASAWALGTMFYLVHAGKHAELLPGPDIFAKLIAADYTVTVSDLAAG